MTKHDNQCMDQESNQNSKRIKTLENVVDEEDAFPFITLTFAQSVNGFIGVRNATTPLLLSGPESMKETHQMRADHESIAVGTYCL